MAVKSSTRIRAAVSQLGNIDVALAALAQMKTPELVAKYHDLYGEPTRSRNRDYLRKRLSWRLQELAEGGLSKSALELIKNLGDGLPETWRRRLAPPVSRRPNSCNPRLPAIGTALSRTYRGANHTVIIRADGVEYEGRRYRTLSAVAKQITGSQWNGYAFFGLAPIGKDSP